MGAAASWLAMRGTIQGTAKVCSLYFHQYLYFKSFKARGDKFNQKILKAGPKNQQENCCYYGIQKGRSKLIGRNQDFICSHTCEEIYISRYCSQSYLACYRV
jgi:hypothetical protein